MYRNKTDYRELSQTIGYQFKQPDLLIQALTRPSALNERRLQVGSNASFQRLEFIGDKVLNLIISDILMEQHPDWQEGELTEAVAQFVNNKGPLATIAHHLEIGHYLIMGRGEAFHNQARTKEKVLSDAVEALLGAIWLDSQHDYQCLRQIISQHWKVLGLPVNRPATKDNLANSKMRPGLIWVNTPSTKIANELNTIFWQLDTETEIFDHFQQWLARQTTPLSLTIAARNYLLDSNSKERPEYLKLLLEKQLLSQTDLDQLLVDSFNFYDSDEDNDEKGAVEKPASIALLLQYGANPNTTLYNDQALLTAAIAYECSANSIELLLKYKANVNWQPDKIRREPSPHTTADVEVSAQSLFFKKPAKKVDLNTALHTLAGKHYATSDTIEIAELLLRYKADPNLPNHTGQTPLHLACASLFPNLFELLPFHSSEYCPLTKTILIKDLLDNHADVNWQDNQGNTPLHLLLKKWLSLDEPIPLSYSNKSASDLTEEVTTSSTNLFLYIITEMLTANSKLSLTNQAGESAMDLAGLIRLSPQELAVIQNGSDLLSNDLFLQPLACATASYSLAELMPRLIGYPLADAKPLLK